MLGARPNHGVFHDDPVAPDPDGATGLADEARAVQDAHARSNRDVAAQRRIGCHPGRRVDRWTLSRMLDQHRLTILPIIRCGLTVHGQEPNITTRSPSSVRFTPESGQIADMSGCPLRAISGLVRRSKKRIPYSILI